MKEASFSSPCMMISGLLNLKPSIQESMLRCWKIRFVVLALGSEIREHGNLQSGIWVWHMLTRRREGVAAMAKGTRMQSASSR